MKKVLTAIFAIAVMVFAFSATPSHAGDEDGCTHLQKTLGTCHTAQVDEVHDLDQAGDGDETDVADSGDEGSTSAAQESDQ